MCWCLKQCLCSSALQLTICVYVCACVSVYVHVYVCACISTAQLVYGITCGKFAYEVPAFSQRKTLQKKALAALIKVSSC